MSMQSLKERVRERERQLISVGPHQRQGYNYLLIKKFVNIMVDTQKIDLTLMQSRGVHLKRR